MPVTPAKENAYNDYRFVRFFAVEYGQTRQCVYLYLGTS